MQATAPKTITMTTIALEIGADGIAVASLDVPGRSMNTVTHAVMTDLEALARRARDDPSIAGVILRSAKPNGFCVGADLDELASDMAGWRAAEGDAARRAAVESAGRFSRALRAVETCGKPFAAVIEGPALGGGLELALACHLRIAADGGAVRLGLPEAKLDLMPGAGGTQRLPRLMGFTAALAFLLDGEDIALDRAAQTGVVHAVVPADEVVARCRAGLKTHPAAPPWDQDRFAPPGGALHSAAGYATFPAAIAAAVGADAHAHPGKANILRAVYEGGLVNIDAALRIETRYFFRTAITDGAAQCVQAFLQRRRATTSPRDPGTPTTAQTRP